MSFLQLLVLVINNLGTIYKLLQLLSDLVHLGGNKRADLSQLKDGIKAYYTSGDTSLLKDLLCRLEGRCQK